MARWLLPDLSFNSFEVQLLNLDWNGPLCIDVIYRPPHSTKDFIKHFIELMGNMTISDNRFILVGDFNIHICCQSNSFAQDFINLLDPFGITQWIHKTTHALGHTLDLLLSFSIELSDIVLSQFLISDHIPILFTPLLTKIAYCPNTPTMLSTIYTSNFSSDFNQCFTDFYVKSCLDDPSSELDAEQHLDLLHSVCQIAAIKPAPLKLCRQKIKSEPWKTLETRTLKQKYRQAEHKWKKGQTYHVSSTFQICSVFCFRKKLYLINYKDFYPRMISLSLFNLALGRPIALNPLY